jgi:hypothetical protein
MSVVSKQGRWLRWILVAIAVVGLGIDAYTHFDLASLYRFNKTDFVSEASLFRIEAVLAILVGLALLIRPNLLTAGAVFLVAAGGLGLLLLYRYVDVGKIGPIPNMYEPIWSDEKLVCMWGEVAAAVASLALVVQALAMRRHRSPALV